MNAMAIHKVQRSPGALSDTCQNELPWAPNTAHLFTKSLLSSYCTAEHELGDGGDE